MAGKRKGVRMVQEIQRLKKLGLGKKAVARALRISRNTLKRYWDGEGEVSKGQNGGWPGGSESKNDEASLTCRNTTVWGEMACATRVRPAKISWSDYRKLTEH